MNTVAPLLRARIAFCWRLVLGGKTPFARRVTMVRGRERSLGDFESERAANLGYQGEALGWRGEMTWLLRREWCSTSILMPSRSFTGVPPPSGSVADIWEMLLLRGGIVEGVLRDADRTE